MTMPSKGIVIYVGTMIINWILNITNMWIIIFRAILKIGLRDSIAIGYIDNISVNMNPALMSYHLAGTIVGSIIFAVMVWGILNLESWGRKLLLFTIILQIGVYLARIHTFISFFRKTVTQQFWLGHYLFVILVVLMLGYLISLVVFFTRKDVKIQFS